MKLLIAVNMALLLLLTSCSTRGETPLDDINVEQPQSQASGEQPSPQPEPEPEQEQEPAAEDPPVPEPAPWAQVYHDYLTKYDIVTYTNFHEGEGAVGIGYSDGERIWISVGVQFRRLPGYDYPVMLGGKFGEDFPNFADCWYFIVDGKLAEEYVFVWEEMPEGYDHLYEMIQGEGYSYPAPKGEQVAEFRFRGDDGAYEIVPLYDALNWLESQ